jgi:hypothetical protein
MSTFDIQHKRVNYFASERKQPAAGQPTTESDDGNQPEPYIVPPKAGSITFEEAHPKAPKLAPSDAKLDVNGEMEKCAKSGRAALRAASTFFDGSDDTDPSAYAYVHHDAKGSVYKSAVQKGLSDALKDITAPRMVGKAQLSEQAYNVVKSHLERHGQVFGINPDSD